MSTFFVPVRESKAGTLALRTARLRSGQRVGLAFTSEASLLLTMGPSQQWVHLDGQALEDMLEPLGVNHVRVDPRPIADLEASTPPERQPGPLLSRLAGYSASTVPARTGIPAQGCAARPGCGLRRRDPARKPGRRIWDGVLP